MNALSVYFYLILGSIILAFLVVFIASIFNINLDPKNKEEL